MPPTTPAARKIFRAASGPSYGVVVDSVKVSVLV